MDGRASDPAPQSDETLRQAARVALERAAQEKVALERAQQERIAAEQAALEKAAADQYAAERAAAEKAAAEAAEKQKGLAEKAAAEKAVADATAQQARAAADKAANEARKAKEATAKAAAKAREEKASAEKAIADKAAAEKSAAQKAAAALAAEARAAAEKAASESKAAEQKAQQKLVAEKTASEKSAAQKVVAAKASADKRSADQAVSAALHAPIPVKIVEVDNQRSPPPAVIGRLALAGSAEEGERVEDVLSELFERTPVIFAKSQSEALYFLLDLAMEKIPCESGTFYVADLNRRDLGFAAVRGPKADALLKLKLRVPMGKGFVGFCAQEGVAVAISDAQRDKRFFSEISQRLGYDTQSMITTPVIHEHRTLGAIQLINRTGSTAFSPSELSILHYLAHQAALFLETTER